MADPTGIMAGVGMASNVAGGIFGAIGAEKQGAATAAMYNYKAGVAAINQQVNKQNANWALEAGDINAEESGLAAGQNIAATKTAQAAGGFDVNTGSNVATRASQVSASAFDQALIRWGAAKTAYGYNVKATMDQAEENIDIASASNAKQAASLNAIQSILGGVASTAAKWSQASSIGLPNPSSWFSNPSTA